MLTDENRNEILSLIRKEMKKEEKPEPEFHAGFLYMWNGTSGKSGEAALEGKPRPVILQPSNVRRFDWKIDSLGHRLGGESWYIMSSPLRELTPAEWVNEVRGVKFRAAYDEFGNVDIFHPGSSWYSYSGYTMEEDSDIDQAILRTFIPELVIMPYEQRVMMQEKS